MEAPSREESKTLLKEFPTVWPYPASNGSAVNFEYDSVDVSSSLMSLSGISNLASLIGIIFTLLAGLPLTSR